MEEFNNIEKVKALFASVNGLGNENLFFVACQDKEKVSGAAAGMEYPYDGLLINMTENGLGFFYLKQAGIVLTQNLAKMTLDKDSYTFISNDEIKNVTVKKFALLNSKVKRISIDTADKSYKLFAKIEEKDIPYQTDNFTKFIEKYSK